MQLLRAFFLLLVIVLSARAAEPNTLTDEEKAAGWKLLFDGTKLTGFRGLQKPDPLKAGWKIDKGTLVLAKEIKQQGKVTGGDLMTNEAFNDFEFSFEWKLTVGANSGVRYFVRAQFGTTPFGHEYQLVDDVRHPDGLKGGPSKRTASLYGILAPAQEKELHDADQWNEGRIVVQGNQVEHWLNGAKVLAYELGSPALMAAVRVSKMRVPPAFGIKFKTPLVLLDEGEEIAFRNLKVRTVAAK